MMQSPEHEAPPHGPCLPRRAGGAQLGVRPCCGSCTPVVPTDACVSSTRASRRRSRCCHELLMVTGSKRGVEIKLELSVEKTSTEEDIRSNVLTGRKLAFGDAIKEQKVAKISGSKTSTGAKHSVGKCGHGGGKDLSTNCYFRTRKPPQKVYFDGHIPFTADYGRPRKHPPKNN